MQIRTPLPNFLIKSIGDIVSNYKRWMNFFHTILSIYIFSIIVLIGNIYYKLMLGAFSLGFNSIL